MADAGGTIALECDARAFLCPILYPSGRWFQYAYTDAGYRSRRESDDGHVVTTYSYDAAGSAAALTLRRETIPTRIRPSCSAVQPP